MRHNKSGKQKAARHTPLEKGAVHKSHGGKIAAALCYPNTYSVAMGNLGFHQVYHLFNSFSDVVCERAVWEGETPHTIESGLPLQDFEIIAFSISYEPDVINMARMLVKAGIPLSADERGRRNSPIILAGGVMAFLNPEPPAPFADVVAVGEAEVLLAPFLEAYREFRTADRQELFSGLCHVPGIYVPSLYEVSYNEEGTIHQMTAKADAPPVVERRFLPRLGEDMARTRVFTESAEFSDMVLVELGRGCVNSCRFCAAAYIYRPPRFAPADKIKEVLQSSCDLRSKAGLVSASATDHPEFLNIREAVRQNNMSHSVASLRLEGVTPDLLAEMKEHGHKTITLAPEAPTERLRRSINKPIKDSEILATMHMIGASGIPRLKLYLQAGLPSETEEDVDAAGPFLERILEALAEGSNKKSWPGRLAVSVNPFVPKPATPFQWHPMAGRSVLQERTARLKRAAMHLGRVSFSGTSVREACLQAVIARGDRRTAQIIAKCAEQDTSAAGPLQRGGEGTPPGRFYSHRQREFAETLGWDHIDHGVKKKLLWKEYENALKEKTTPKCRPGRCELCDACARAEKLRQKAD